MATNTADNFLSRAHERYRQTTDGRATAYSERERGGDLLVASVQTSVARRRRKNLSVSVSLSLSFFLCLESDADV